MIQRSIMLLLCGYERAKQRKSNCHLTHYELTLLNCRKQFHVWYTCELYSSSWLVTIANGMPNIRLELKNNNCNKSWSANGLSVISSHSEAKKVDYFIKCVSYHHNENLEKITHRLLKHFYIAQNPFLRHSSSFNTQKQQMWISLLHHLRAHAVSSQMKILK